jgi:tetratricopeptide (TPR) repeat protein
MKLIFIFFCFVGICNPAYPQNKIYLQDEVKDGKVTEITPDEIKYKDPSNPTQVNSLLRNNVLLLFNDKGGFLVVSKPDSSSLFLSKSLINNFINSQNDTTISADRIFTRNKKIISCNIINEDILSLVISLNGLELKVDKSTAAVVIYKNGEHKLTAPVETAADVLYTFQLQNKLNSRTISAAKALLPPPPEIKKVVGKSDENLRQEKKEPEQNDKPQIIEQKQVLVNDGKAAADSVIAAKENDMRYAAIVGNANSLYKRGDYSKAKYFYLKASELKPGEKEPLDGLDSINKKLASLQKFKDDSAEYFADLVTANRLANSKKWDSALIIYNKAAELRPEEDYPHKQIKYVQSEIDKLKAEAKQRELEIKFNNAMARADVAVKEKRYEVALADYNEALSIHPDNAYAKDRAKILTYQVGLHKKAADNKD